VLHEVVSGTPEAQTACEHEPPPPLLLPLLDPLPELEPLLDPLELPLLELVLPLLLPLLELVLPLLLPLLELVELPLLLPLLELVELPLLLPLLELVELLLLPPERAAPFGVPHPVGPSYPTPAVHSMVPQLPFLPEVTS
jgi:hypothetical protein